MSSSPSRAISLPRTWMSTCGEGVLDRPEHLVALAEEQRHQVVAGNGDLDLGARHDGGKANGRARTEPYARSVDDRPAGRRVGRRRRRTRMACSPEARPSLAARLDAWLADARVEGSADARAREHWLRAAAEADATFSGVLLDLAERGSRHRGGDRRRAPTAGGGPGARRRLRGAARRLGRRGAAVHWRRSPPCAPRRRWASPSGERVVTTDLRLGDVLGELAAERARVRLVAARRQRGASAGELRSVGQDVVTVRTDGEAPRDGLRRAPARSPRWSLG